jgi:glycine hydroxymethyltransferase
MELIAEEFKPEIIIAGISAYPRDLDYSKFRKVCDKVGAILLADISHIAGLISSGLLNDPFKYCDVVTSTTHKTLNGPRSGIIFCKKEYQEKIDFTVFPHLQGGPHMH